MRRDRVYGRYVQLDADEEAAQRLSESGAAPAAASAGSDNVPEVGASTVWPEEHAVVRGCLKPYGWTLPFSHGSSHQAFVRSNVFCSIPWVLGPKGVDQ